MESFRKHGLWLKGNLHLHSTLSDGKKTPEELFKLYKAAGYDFLSLTDHWKLYPAGEKYGLLLIAGSELNAKNNYLHTVGLNLKSIPEEREGESVYRHLIDNSEFKILAHPNWSILDINNVSILKEMDALEVYNTGCEMEICKGYSEYFWDAALERGIRIYAVATDDAHEKLEDYCKAFVMVKAKDKSEASIIKALKTGDFYASNGPLFEEIALESGAITVKSKAPCREIRFIGKGQTGSQVAAKDNKGITEAVYKPAGKIPYCRIELIDLEGRKAWSNPIWFI